MIKTPLPTLYENKEYKSDNTLMSCRNSSRPRIKGGEEIGVPIIKAKRTVSVPIYVLFDNSKPFSCPPYGIDMKTWNRFISITSHKKFEITHNHSKSMKYFRYADGKFMMKSFMAKKFIDIHDIRYCTRSNLNITLATKENGILGLRASEEKDALLIEKVINGFISDVPF